MLMKIGILCGYRFPEGMAATSRIIAYSKGLIDNGIDVEVILFRPTEYDKLDFPRVGKIDKLKYRYPYKRKWSSISLLRWFWDRPISYLKTTFYIFRSNREEKTDFIFLSFDSIQNLIFFSIILRLIKIKPIFIGDEYPIPIRHFLKVKIPWWKSLAYRIALRFLSAKILMTENLGQYYNNIFKTPTYILTSITDISRFLETKISTDNKKYLCYMGNMELTKDNVDLIIRAFFLIHNKYPYIDLHLYGTPQKKDRIFLEQLVAELKLDHKIKFMGRADYNNVPIILSNAHILLSSQPQTIRASGGFPTKLGEYLVSGVPSLMTDVGEISNFITHKVHAFLATPENVEDYGNQISFIMDNYTVALDIASNGQKYVTNNFSPKEVVKELIVFLKNLR
jgi:glycosyltransferase involved in cell wall biosynthesis